ncbi:hypothetical protein [Aestuariivirga litoralis]|uniref:hypothetical protein n=1 Tax=Aestuariivirga litoralis TaxID=2650924 RepID=UPI0018C723B4|nr:hypothetical protein [Aestuariivirga litoralis]MBG1232524.1 hypothetical protein [Aestuariivirga litoralis]
MRKSGAGILRLFLGSLIWPTLLAILIALSVTPSLAEQLVFSPQPATKTATGVTIYAPESGCEDGECNGLSLSCDANTIFKLALPYIDEDAVVSIIRKQELKLALSMNGTIFNIDPNEMMRSDESGNWEVEGVVAADDFSDYLKNERIYLLIGSDTSKIESNENLKKFAQDCYELVHRNDVKAKPTEIPRDQYWNCKNGSTNTGEVRTMIRKSSGVMTLLSKKSGLNFKAPFRYCQSSHCTWVIDGATDKAEVNEKSGSVYMTMQSGSDPTLQIYLPTGELDCEVEK